MDKIFSSRIDESVAYLIAGLAKRLRTSKKSVIEQAVRSFAKQSAEQGQDDVFEQAFGAWKRDEPVQATVENARRRFQAAMRRHHQ
ncbi:MAG: hypothetical protein NTX50_27145 [Candidatus Sumerlaeota bacterium]|nr:hypothetical protein [Candidatus Sumerlaeota bacterium]